MLLLKPKSSKTNDAHEFRPLLAEIEEAPTSPLAQTVFWLVIMVILSFAVWMVLGQIDIVVSANGKVIPDGEVKIIQPLDTGAVSNILVKEGDFVHKGQVLMEIDPTSIAPEVESTQKNIAYTELESQRLLAAATGTGFAPRVSGGSRSMVATQVALYNANEQSLTKQLVAKEEELKRLDEEMHSAQVEQRENQDLLQVANLKEMRLSKVLDIIARDEYEKVTNDILTYKDRVQQAEFKLRGLDHQKSQTRQDIGRIQHDAVASSLNDLSDRQKQLADLNAKLEETSFKHAKQKIVSPVNGHIDKLFIHTVGGVVTPAEKLISIVPDQTPLIVQASVLNKDIGFIEQNMPVAIKVDTFEFQKYGMFDGKVKLVPHNSREDEKLGLVYDAFITPTTKYLMVEGREQVLSPGMSVVAEIKVGKRRIIEFFVYPLIKYLHEGMSVR